MRGYIEDEFSKRENYIMVDSRTGDRLDETTYLMTVGEVGTSNYAYAMNGKNRKLVKA